MWNSELYSLMIEKAAKNQMEIYGEQYKSKEAIYEAISDNVHLDKNTVKGWIRKSSGGPGDMDIWRELESLFGCSFSKEAPDNIIETTPEEEKSILQKNYSDFTKMHILECYNIMMDYLHSDDVEFEKAYVDMYTELSKHEMAIPTEIYQKIEDFCEAHLAPIVYAPEMVFADGYAAAEMTENGLVCHTPEQTMAVMANFCTVLLQIEEKLRKFGKEELQLILTI